MAMTNVLPFIQTRDDKAVTYTLRAHAILADGQWHTAKAIKETEPQLDERTMRAIAERSDGELLSVQKGYRLTRFATAAEARHAESWLQSQGKKMIARAVEIRNARARAQR